jgi:methionine salvage enolase-phosphatase E1
MSSTYNTVILDIEGTTTPITFVKDVLVRIHPDITLPTEHKVSFCLVSFHM